MRGSALRSAFRRSSLPWSYPCSKSHIVEPWPVGWVPLSDLALTKMVRAKGLEPPHLAILVPKTSASTNSATPAGAVGRVHDVTDRRARPCGPRGAIADASPTARAEGREYPRTKAAERRGGA